MCITTTGIFLHFEETITTWNPSSDLKSDQQTTFSRGDIYWIMVNLSTPVREKGNLKQQMASNNGSIRQQNLC